MKVSAIEKFNKIKSALIDAVYPSTLKCVFCEDELGKNPHNFTCKHCFKNLPFIAECCSKCGMVMLEEFNGICPDCRNNNYYFDRAISVFIYKDEIVRTIHNLKYNGDKPLAEKLATYLIEAYATTEFNADIITAVPMHPNKLKVRGYNQAELLAQAVAEKFNIPYLPLCRKVVDNPTQTALSYMERKTNIKGVFAFNAEYKQDVKNKIVLIIDDIFTTGATSNELTSIIKKAGANKVYVLTLGRSVGELLNKPLFPLFNAI